MKRALVTGAAAGLGAAMADQLAAGGWHVVGLDRAKGPHVSISADLARPQDVDRVLDDARASGPFDLVVLNAGISATGRFETIPLAAHEGVLGVNAEAPIVMANGLIRGKALNAGASLVFVSSLSHFVGYPGAASYAASKSAIAIYAKSIRKPANRRGFAVTLACPGPMKTAQAARHAPENADASKRMTPEEAAKVILKAARARRFLVVPGSASRASAWFGRLLPGLSTRTMRALIYDKLDRDVW